MTVVWVFCHGRRVPAPVVDVGVAACVCGKRLRVVA